MVSQESFSPAKILCTCSTHPACPSQSQGNLRSTNIQRWARTVGTKLGCSSMLGVSWCLAALLVREKPTYPVLFRRMLDESADATYQPPVEARGMVRKRKVVGRGYGRDGRDGSTFGSTIYIIRPATNSTFDMRDCAWGSPD